MEHKYCITVISFDIAEKSEKNMLAWLWTCILYGFSWNSCVLCMQQCYQKICIVFIS